MGASRNRTRLLRLATIILAGLGLCWVFPLVHVKPLASPAANASAAAPDTFDARTTAEKFWREQLLPAAGQAADLAAVVRAVRTDAAAARKSFGKPAGVGVDYFFARGSGKVVARERNVLSVVVDGAPGETVELRIGPVFGNTVRDGTGLLNVNAFAGLQDFNALAAELNALVEKNVLPALREKAQVGATIHFAGCAEVPETAEDVGAPLFLIVPVIAEVK